MHIAHTAWSQTTVYSDDFEVDFEGWSTTDWTRDADAALGASDGNYLHPTDFDDYSASTDVTTTSGTIDLTGFYSLVLQIDISYNTDDTGGLTNDEDGFNIEYSPNGGGIWNLLGSSSEGINWYNDDNGDVDALNDDGWTGDNGGWQTAYIFLPAQLENNSQVQFRVNFATGNNGFLENTDVGIGFDNFIIISYSSNNGAPGNVSTGLSLWLKADGRAITINDELALWGDESGNDNHAREETSADRPFVGSQTINFNPVIEFDDSHIEGTSGIYTHEIFVVIDPDFISSTSAETGDVLGYQPGDVGSLELGSATVQFADELITHTINPNPSYRSAFQDPTGEVVLANPMIINDRSNATNNGQNLFLNGDQVDNIESVPGDHQFFSDGAYILGYGFDISDDFQGGMAEVISYSSRLSDSDQRDVQTYLGIKYGITLDEDPSSSTVNYDYQINGGTLIWPGTTNADYQSYHNDVAGIGRNRSDQELDQTSSQSINDATIVNMENASGLDDGEYLVWGNDNNPNSFTTNDAMPGITNRLERIWKVKETGEVGTVALNFNITNLAVDKDNTTLNLLIAPSTATMPTDLGDEMVTTLVAGGTVTSSAGQDILTFNNVDFSDGDFFTLGGDVQTIAPGGVSGGLTLWLRPDEGLETSGNLVTSWKDISSNGNDVDQGDDNEKPSLVNNEINNNDAIDFSDDFLDGVAGFNTTEYFLVLKPDQTIQGGGGNGFVTGFRNGSYDGFYLGIQGTDTIAGHAVQGYRSAYVDAVASIDRPVIIFNSRNNAGGTAQDILADGIAVDNGESGTFSNRTNTHFRLGDNMINSDSYDGKISEVISYNTRLSDSDRRDVETYLAIKYGITLDISSESYTVGGSSIYDNTSYDDDIAGIGSNLDHGLRQLRSQSSNTGSILKFEAGSDFSSGDYVLWGNDGTDKTLVQNTELPSVSFQERLNAEWQIDVTGDPEEISVKVNLANITDFASRPKNASLYALLINNSNDFSTVTSSIEGSSFSGDTVVFNNVTFQNNDFCTVVVPPIPSGALGKASGTLWLSTDKGVTTSVNDVTQWDNQVVGAGLSAIEDVDGSPPLLTSANGFNVIEFDGTTYLESNGTQARSNLFGASDNTATVVLKSDGGSDLAFWETASTDRFSIGLNGNNASMTFTEAPAEQANGATDLVTPATYNIITFLTESGGNGNDIFINGGSSDGNNSSGSLSSGSAAFGMGARPDGSSGIDADLAEIAVWSAALSANDRRDVESSLAIKYGIDLDITTGYTYDGGTVIYNRNGFGNRIRGIGANNDQGLFVSTSASINGGDIVTLSNPSSLNNDDYLLCGDDGAALTYINTGLPPAVSERVTRKWGVDEENDVGTVSITIDVSSEDNTGYVVGDFALILDNNSDFTDGIIDLIPASSFVSEIVTISNVDFSGATHFGLATQLDIITDTDSDGIPDYFEIAYGTNYNDGDSPVSGGGGTPPTDTDDNTGPAESTSSLTNGRISDALEQILLDNGASSIVTRLTDTDGDGISDWREVRDGTNPFDADAPDANGSTDTDNDGLPDALESLITSEGGAADPNPGTDTDNDGISDYYEVLNGYDPGDADSPLAGGGSLNDTNDGTGSQEGSAPIISDALEALLIEGGGSSPIELTSDTDSDGIPDYIEVITYTDPYNDGSPEVSAAVSSNIRGLQADYQTVNPNCETVNGFKWIHVVDNLGNLVYSINPVGNDLDETCWAVRVLNGEPNVRKQVIDGVQDEYVMNRNWWINPTNQPSNNYPVYLRFYSLSNEPVDMRNKVIGDGHSPDVLANFVRDSINFTKIGSINDLDPFVSGARTLHHSVGSTFNGSDYMFTLGIPSFSSFVPFFAPLSSETALPVELTYFIGQIDGSGIDLEWRTSTEINNDVFVVKKSKDGINFHELTRVIGSGNSREPVNYSAFDPAPYAGLNYYQLNQIDFDGTSTASSIIVVNYDENLKSWKLYPNPASDLVQLRVDNQKSPNNHFRLALYNLKGKKEVIDFNTTEHEVSFDVSLLPSGYYLLRAGTGKTIQTFLLYVDH